MGGLSRLYAIASSIAFAALLGGVAFLAVASVVVPEWFGAAARSASTWIASLPGEDLAGLAARSQVFDGASEEIPPGGAGLAPVSRADSRSPATGSATGASDALWAGAPSPAARPGSPPVQGGIGSLEETLRRLESDIARWKAAPDDRLRPAPAPGRSSETLAKLAAWEDLRRPLFALVEAGGATRALDAGADSDIRPDADIRDISSWLGRRLGDLRVAYQGRRTDLLGGLDPNTIFFVLLDDEALGDEEAIGFLLGLSRPDALRILDRLARLSPERAGRLIRGLRGPPTSSAGGTTERGPEDLRLTGRDRPASHGSPRG